MGNTEAKHSLIPPWESGDASKPYSEAVQSRIKALSLSVDAFMKPFPGKLKELEGFDISNSMHAIEGALAHDKKLSQWLPKLVPKRVSEEDFWRNYFSHVRCVVDGEVSSVAEANLQKAAAGLSGRETPPLPPAQTSSAQAPTAAPASNGTNGTAAAPSTAQLQPTMNGRGEHKSTPNGTPSAASALGSARAPQHPLTAIELKQQQMQPPPTPQRALGEEELPLEAFELYPEPPIQYNEKGLGRPIRWGIIGCGDVCETKSGPAFAKAAGSKLVAVMRRTPELAQDFAKRHNVAKVYTVAEDLIRDPEVDAVYIATPPGSHAELALKVCEAGKPCLIEKPMARHYDECRMLVERFYRVNLPLYVAHYRRRHDRFIKARQIMQRFLGRITSVHAVFARSDHINPDRHLGWRVSAAESGGGLFLDLATHTLDILDYLLGPLAHVQGDAVTHAAADPQVQVETNVTMTFRTPSGATGTAIWDFCSAIYEDKLTINGTKAKLTMSIFGKDGPQLHLPSGKTIKYKHAFPEHVHQPLIEAIVLQLRGAPVPSDRLSTGESAARTSLVMDSVLRKFYKSRSDHFWKRPHTWDNKRQINTKASTTIEG